MSTPKTSDGRAILLTSRFRGDVDPFFAGSCDNSTTPGEGQLFMMGWTVAPTEVADKQMIVQFDDWIYISSGQIRWQGGGFVSDGVGDWMRIRVVAPATTVALASPANTGDCNLVPTGLGFNLIAPAVGDGTHDVVSAAPVPSIDSEGNGTGYWSWDSPDKGKGVVSAGVPDESLWNLYDVTQPLVQWVRKMPLLGSGVESLDPGVKSRKILPHWQCLVDLHNEALGLLQVSWAFTAARKKTI